MSVTDIFSDDPQEERLASYFEELYEYLLEEGVPEECLPSPWHVLRRVTKAVDHDKLRAWLDAYAEVEADPEAYERSEDDETTAAPPPLYSSQTRPRARPPYLRALESHVPRDKSDDEDPADG